MVRNIFPVLKDRVRASLYSRRGCQAINHRSPQSGACRCSVLLPEGVLEARMDVKHDVRGWMLKGITIRCNDGRELTVQPAWSTFVGAVCMGSKITPTPISQKTIDP